MIRIGHPVIIALQTRQQTDLSPVSHTTLSYLTPTLQSIQLM